MYSYLGQICLFPWDWAPRGWAKCDGSMLDIASNQALFTLIGIQFGGNGQTNFALPDLTELAAKSGADVGYYICMQGEYPTRT